MKGIEWRSDNSAAFLDEILGASSGVVDVPTG
jgi:hypothetical protein